MCAKATMNTGSKAQVFVRAAIGDKRVGDMEMCAGRDWPPATSAAHLLPGFHWYAPDRHLLIDQAPDRSRSVVPQKFINRGGMIWRSRISR